MDEFEKKQQEEIKEKKKKREDISSYSVVRMKEKSTWEQGQKNIRSRLGLRTNSTMTA